MKPRFEEHDNQLFRMLEEPVPLAPDSKLPCLVRLIQDDSPMGKYNNDRDYFDVISDMLFIAQKIKENPYYGISAYGNTLHAYEKNSLNQDYCIASIHTLEIIGYPVEEGFAEWALWAMMDENKVINSNGIVPFTLTDDRIVRIDDSVSWDVGHWLRIFDDTTGWQIYTEPKPEPLLADAKVGDLCKRMDGKWVQIETLCSLGGMPWICYEIGGLRYINNGEQLNTKDRNLDIIDYHPLAPEGTAEWALQMWKLGNDIRNETGVVLMADYESEEIRVKHLVDVFPSGWQLYKEPKPEQQNPMPTTEFVDLSDAPAGWICKTRDGGNYPLKYIEVSPTRYAYEDKSGLTVYVMANGRYKKNGTDGRDIIACEPEQPKSAHKVGDFVVCTYYRSQLPQKNRYERVIEVSGNGIVTKANDGCVTEYDINGNHGDINGWHIDRVISPCEHIVTIGCLSGTVRPVSTNGIHIWFHLIGVDDKTIATIRIESLDARTRELVESLLKAQEEEK